MTTISDYDIAVIENESTPDPRYSTKRNKQSFDMFAKGIRYREEITEQLTARLIAKQLGHEVTGSDKNLYDPMKSVLKNEKINL